MANDSNAQKVQSEQLQITKTPSESTDVGKILEFHVFIQSATLPGCRIDAACHASNIDIKQAQNILWNLRNLIDLEQ